MIGAFARMFNGGKRVEEIDTAEDVVHTRAPGGVTDAATIRDAPPEAFVEKVEAEGGDVYVVPFLETLRNALRRRRGRA